MRQLLTAFQKDVLLQWRTRTQLLAIFTFGASTELLFSFAIGPNAEALRLHAAGFLWLSLLLAFLAYAASGPIQYLLRLRRDKTLS